MPEAILGHAAAVYSKIWPALLGAVIALYFHPHGATRLDKLSAGSASVAVAVLFGPAAVEYFEVESRAVENTIYGVLALFGLNVTGQVMTTIREVGLAAMVREWLRQWFRLPKE